MKPLFSSCQNCKAHPVAQTRQRALGARPAGKWYQVCAQHIPGAALKWLPSDHHLVQTAAKLNAHEVVAL